MAANGWPSATAPPFGLTLAGSEAELAADAQRLHGEGFVRSMTSMSLSVRPARCKRQLGGGNRAGAHDARIDAGNGIRHQARQRLETGSFGGGAGFHQHHRGGTVVDAGSIAGSDRAVLLEGRPELGQAFHRDIGLRVFVGVEQHRALAALDLDRHDLRLEMAGGDGGHGSLLALQGESVLVPRPILNCSAMFSAVMPMWLGLNGSVSAPTIMSINLVSPCAREAGGRHQVAGAAHGLDAAADGDVGVAELDRVGCGDDGLEAGTAQAIQRQGAGEPCAMPASMAMARETYMSRVSPWITLPHTS